MMIKIWITLGIVFVLGGISSPHAFGSPSLIVYLDPQDSESPLKIIYEKSFQIEYEGGKNWNITPK